MVDGHSVAYRSFVLYQLPFFSYFDIGCVLFPVPSHDTAFVMADLAGFKGCPYTCLEPALESGFGCSQSICIRFHSIKCAWEVLWLSDCGVGCLFLIVVADEGSTGVQSPYLLHPSVDKADNL